MTLRDSLTTVLLLIITVVAHGVIWLHGAAANPYAVLVLVPMAAAMLLLPFHLAWTVMVAGVVGQLLQLQAPLPTMHGMDTHYRAMVYGQVFAALLLGVTLHWLRTRILKQQAALRAMHLRQHRDEQLVTIGTAAAQFSHEVATPIQTMQFTLEDARQRYPNDEDLQRVEQQIRRVHNLLMDWREVAEDVRAHRVMALPVTELVGQLRDAMLIARPDVRIDWHHEIPATDRIEADRTLLPALLSLLHNAADAAVIDSQIQVATTVQQTQTGREWQLVIRNHANHQQAAQLRELGLQLQPSQQGVGAGAFLSYATLERFGGRVRWWLDHEEIVTEVTLPVVDHD